MFQTSSRKRPVSPGLVDLHESRYMLRQNRGSKSIQASNQPVQSPSKSQSRKRARKNISSVQVADNEDEDSEDELEIKLESLADVVSPLKSVCCLSI